MIFSQLPLALDYWNLRLTNYRPGLSEPPPYQLSPTVSIARAQTSTNGITARPFNSNGCCAFMCVAPPLPPQEGETLLRSSGEDSKHFVLNCSPELPRKSSCFAFIYLTSLRPLGRHYIGQYTEAVRNSTRPHRR